MVERFARHSGQVLSATATPDDFTAIRSVLCSAFETPAEADLVEAPRAERCVLLELVAESGDAISGHVLFSHLPIEASGRTVRGAALAHAGVQAVVVLGHPAYYPRCGFSANLALHLQTPLPGVIEGLAARPRVWPPIRRSAPQTRRRARMPYTIHSYAAQSLLPEPWPPPRRRRRPL